VDSRVARLQWIPVDVLRAMRLPVLSPPLCVSVGPLIDSSVKSRFILEQTLHFSSPSTLESPIHSTLPNPAARSRDELEASVPRYDIESKFAAAV
jgi:hypothetical protein